MKTYYFPNDNPDGWFGSSYPVCVGYREAARLCKEYSDPESVSYTVDYDWHVATDEEINTFGTYNSEEE